VDAAERKELGEVDFEGLKAELQATAGVTWEFNVPTASQRMGLVERRIRVLRNLMQATLLETGKRLLDREELCTFFAEVCYISNETPLTDTVGATEDPAPLTANMLLNLKEGSHPDEGPYGPADMLEYGKKRWRRVQFLSSLFYTRFKAEYLHELNQRRKWLRPTTALAVGDTVIMKEKGLKRSEWRLARVDAVEPGHDGLVRSARVKAAHTAPDGTVTMRVYDRPCTGLVVLVPATATADGQDVPADQPGTLARVEGVPRGGRD
jgi:hypothetical protein